MKWKILKDFIKITSILFICILFIFAILIFNYPKISMQKFTTEEKYLYSVKSPYDKKKVYIYLFNGGVITGYYIQGEVEFKNGEKRNIYFNDDEGNVKVKWTGKNSLIINNHLIEDINRDFYNFKFE